MGAEDYRVARFIILGQPVLCPVLGKYVNLLTRISWRLNSEAMSRVLRIPSTHVGAGGVDGWEVAEHFVCGSIFLTFGLRPSRP